MILSSTGNKIFVTNGGYLGTGILFASMDRNLKHKGISAFIVDLDSRGRGNPEK